MLSPSSTLATPNNHRKEMAPCVPGTLKSPVARTWEEEMANLGPGLTPSPGREGLLRGGWL